VHSIAITKAPKSECGRVPRVRGLGNFGGGGLVLSSVIKVQKNVKIQLRTCELEFGAKSSKIRWNLSWLPYHFKFHGHWHSIW